MRLAGTVCALVACACGALLFFHRLETGGDNLDYIATARAIRNGQWADVAAEHRPLGYGAYLAGLLAAMGVRLDPARLALSPSTVYGIKAVNVLWFGAAVWFVWAWCLAVSRDRRVALAAALLVATNQTTAAWASVIGPEPVFLLLTFWALTVWEEKLGRVATGRGVAAFLLAGTALALVKHQGLVLAPAVAAWLILKRRRDVPLWSLAGLLLAVGLLSLALQWRGSVINATQLATGKWMDPIAPAGWVPRAGAALAYYVPALVHLMFPKIFWENGALELLGVGWLRWGVVAVVWLVMAVGLASTLRSGLRLAHTYALCMVLLLVVWPHLILRLLMPLLPVGLWLFLEGLSDLARRWDRNRPGWDARVLTGFLCLALSWAGAVNMFAGVKNWSNILSFRTLPPWAPERYRVAREDDFADYVAAAEWLKGNVPPDARVSCRKPLFVELASERAAFSYGDFASPDELWDALIRSARESPTFVVEDTFPASSAFGRPRVRLLMPVLAAHADELPQVHQEPGGTRVYEVDYLGAHPVAP